MIFAYSAFEIPPGETKRFDYTVPFSTGGEVDTEMGGNLTITGIVKDNSGNVVPDVYVTVSVCAPGGCEPEGGTLGDFWVFTDDTGSYSFKNLLTGEDEVERYEVWFNGGQQYGKEYENSGYHIDAKGMVMSGDLFYLDVTVYPVTGSAFVGIIQYVDSDGTTKNFFSNPDNWIGIERGTAPHREYLIGAEYYSIDKTTGELSIPGLAGGTYYLSGHCFKSNLSEVRFNSSSFQIPPGETKRFDYTVP